MRKYWLIVYFIQACLTAWAVGFLPDRRQLAPKTQPYLSLCRISGGGGQGCGVLVGSDLVLTCAHVVSSEKGDVHADANFEFGVSAAGASHFAKAKEVHFPESRSLDPGAGADWALVRIDRPMGLIYGWLPCEPQDGEFWRNNPVQLLGLCVCPDEARSEFGAMNTPYLCEGKVRDWSDRILFHDCSMWGGTSGAPILATSSGRVVVVALNSASVGVEGEKLSNGFRKDYVKELGNIAVPSKNWQNKLRTLSAEFKDERRVLWVRNRSTSPIRVSARYPSVFRDSIDSMCLTDWIEIPPKKRVKVIQLEDGLASNEVWLSVRDRQDNVVGPKQELKFDLKDASDRSFYRLRLAGLSEYTVMLP